MIKHLTLVLALLIVVCSSVALAQVPPSTLPLDSVGMIVSPSLQEICSTVFLAPDVALTAAHCKGVIYIVGKQEISGAILWAIAGDQDFMVGRVFRKNATKFTKVAQEMPKEGERVWLIGYSKELYTIEPGEVATNLNNLLPVIVINMHTNRITSGASGGGVFNEKGELVGIITHVTEEAPYRVWAVGMSHIRQFLYQQQRKEGESK